MKKTLRKKFVFFAMSAVTILLVVLIGTINAFSWFILEKQSDGILHTIVNGEEKILQHEFRERGPFMPPMNMDTMKSTRFFMVRSDADGNVIDINTEQISSVTEQQAAIYAKQVTENDFGRIDNFKYEVKRIETDRLIFFIDISNQMRTFMMVLSISCVIAIICWAAMLIFVFLLSGRVVRPILAGIEKQKQFITNAGHELKTPLTIIQSNNDAATLIYGETKYSRNIRQQTQRLNVLMTNLLTLAKLDEEISLPIEEVNISELICGMLPVYKDAAAQKGIAFSDEIQHNIVMRVHADTFSQMISIMLDNAIKYTADGGRILFSVKNDNGHIQITEENSCDMPSGENPERLFERFYRGDSARTQENRMSGYGIGLSAARAIAENFNGTLTAAYTENKTIRFTAEF